MDLVPTSLLGVLVVIIIALIPQVLIKDKNRNASEQFMKERYAMGYTACLLFLVVYLESILGGGLKNIRLFLSFIYGATMLLSTAPFSNDTHIKQVHLSGLFLIMFFTALFGVSLAIVFQSTNKRQFKLKIAIFLVCTYLAFVGSAAYSFLVFRINNHLPPMDRDYYSQNQCYEYVSIASALFYGTQLAIRLSILG
tara:strand:+ start:345 stop:932 length:588 start_codon:yes stop_codon:yes gene_type:complete